MSQRRPRKNPSSADADPSAERTADNPTPARKPDGVTIPRRAYRRNGITLMPPKLIPLEPVHEQQAISALTELFLQLLESDRRQQHGHDQVEDRQP